jgi:hypothetical protein
MHRGNPVREASNFNLLRPFSARVFSSTCSPGRCPRSEWTSKIRGKSGGLFVQTSHDIMNPESSHEDRFIHEAMPSGERPAQIQAESTWTRRGTPSWVTPPTASLRRGVTSGSPPLASPPAAEQWTRGIGEVNLRAQVLADISLARTEQDIQAAVILAVSEIPPGRMQADVLVGIAGRWVQADAEAAAEWVMQFPAGDLRRDAIATVAAVWSLDNPARAHEWQNRATGERPQQ